MEQWITYLYRADDLVSKSFSGTFSYICTYAQEDLKIVGTYKLMLETLDRGRTGKESNAKPCKNALIVNSFTQTLRR